MNYSLDFHERGYNISYADVLLSMGTMLSCAPYAQRHEELSNRNDLVKFSLGHKIIASLEAIPILGSLAALIERIVVYVYHKLYDQQSEIKSQPSFQQEKFKELKEKSENLVQNPSDWISQALCIDKVRERMLKNQKKAIVEHFLKESQAYANLEKGLITDINVTQPKPLTGFSYSVAAERGRRSSMEDAHFYLEIEHGILTGVFDGHGGRQVAEIASTAFQKRFEKELKENEGNVHKAFEHFFDVIHDEVADDIRLNEMGSTAVVSFIDKNTGDIYTATLGDSEANIYRVINGKVKSIPLSCLRDWSSPKEAKRASIFLENPEILNEWTKKNSGNFKRRFPNSFCGVNISRAIGDVHYTGSREKPGVIHKPKITLNKVQPNDILLLCCDGIKDFVEENEIISLMEKEKFLSINTLVQRLVSFALHDKNSTDNITVVGIQVK